MLDAYTVRKAIPRIVVAVIGINLSIYFCIALIDITNVVGGGMAQLLTAPFNTAGMDAFGVETDKTNAVAGGVGLFLATGPITGAVAAFITSIAAGGALAGAGVILQGLSALFWLLFPITLLVLGILGVVIIRQALLVFLTIISPVAIALFVLPGTEKYFRKWFDLFVKTLLVYPIIAVVFAMSDIFASIIFSNNNGGITGLAKIITGLIVIFAPLFLIPFAFRLAGGAIAAIGKVAGGMGDRISKSGYVQGKQEHYGQQFKDTQLRARAEAFRKSKGVEDDQSRSGFRRRVARYRQGALGGYKEDLYQREAEMTERLAKQQELQKNFGDDTDRRAYGIDLDAARADMAGGFTAETINGRQYRVSNGGLMRQRLDASGNVDREEFVSLGGSWQSESAVKQSERRFGKRNLGQLQQTLGYEMTKAIEEGQQEELIDRYGTLTQAWGMSGSETKGTWIGPAFNNQQEDLMFKHTSHAEDGTASVNYEAMTREVYEKKGPQMLAYLKGKNVKTMREGHARAIENYNDAVTAGDTQGAERAAVELKMHESIADTLSARGGAAVMGAPGAAGPGAPAAPVGGAGAVVTPTGAPGARSGEAEYGYTTGSGHTTDELKSYFSEVQRTARERSATPGGPITNPHRAPGGTEYTVESQAAEDDPHETRPTHFG